MPERFGSVSVHLIADPNLEPWTVKHGDETVPQRNARVILQRDVTHTFRFGEQ